MAYADAINRFQRYLRTDKADGTNGGGLLSATTGVNTPNGVTPSIARTLLFGDDSSLWIGNGVGTTWTQVATSSGIPMSFADNVYLTFGTDSDFKVGYNSGANTGVFGNATVLSAAGGSAGGPGMILFSRPTSTTSAGGGVNSGAVSIFSGSTDCTDAAGTGGDSGSLNLSTGDTGSTAGTSGDSGVVQIHSGDSINANTGEIDIFTGDGAGNSGRARLRTGGSGLASTPGNIELVPGTNGGAVQGVVDLQGPLVSSAFLDPAENGMAPVLAKRFVVSDGTVQTATAARNGLAGSTRILDILVYKTVGAGGAGDQVVISTPAGTITTVDLNGVAAGDVIRLGAATAPASVLNQVLTTGQALTVTPTDATGGVDCEIIVTFAC